MTRARLALAGGALAVVLLVVAVVLAAGGGDDGAAPTTEATTSTTATPTTATLAPGTLPPTVARTTVATTTAVPTTTRSSTTTTTVAPTTTLPPTTAGSTTTVDPDAAPAFPCRADLLLTAYAAAQKVPAGATAERPRCYGVWASVILAAPGLDRAFAVFGPDSGGWQLLNAGTAFVCQRLEVPDPAYTTIGCVDWDR